MKIIVVSIGSEILVGHTVNTNLAFIGGELSRAGYTVDREICIPDDPGVIRSTIAAELAEFDLIITSGGLGPTHDDMSRQIIAESLGLPLHLEPAVLAHIEQFLSRRHVAVAPEVLAVQAMVPEGATALLNSNGTAPGLWIPFNGRVVVMLPGPPRELQPLFSREVLPRIRQLAAPEVARETLRVCGIPESTVAQRVETALAAFPEIDLAYCARPTQVDVRLTSSLTARARLDLAVARLQAEFGDALLPGDQENLVQSVAALLRQGGWWLATAESCTGGGIAAAITDEPGVSDIFAGSFVCYVNAWKERWLGVPAQILIEHGAVSEPTARAMLEGLLQRTGAEAGIAVTGIAGPGGGTEEKPVGLVYIATGVGAARQVARQVFPGHRENVRQRTIATALNQLRRQLLAAV